MNDRWNVKGADWSNENIQRELEKVEQRGTYLANKFLRDKIVLLAVVAGALLFCLLYLDSVIGLAVEFVILLAVLSYMRKTARQAKAPVYEMCDPYLEFAYIRAYARFPMPRGKSTMIRQILSLAQCMALAGEPQAAIAIQSNIEDPRQLKAGEKTIYFNTLLLSYGQYEWTDKRAQTVAELVRMRDGAGKREAMQLDVVIRLEELKRHQDMGDIDFVEDYFKRIPPVLPFQEVGMHYALGMMYMKAGDAEKARPHVEFVLDKGNKLYYKKNLEEYLRRSLRNDGGQDDQKEEGGQSGNGPDGAGQTGDCRPI